MGSAGGWHIRGSVDSLIQMYAVYGLIAGNPGQLLPQLVGILVAIVWGFGGGYILFKILDLTMGLRVDEQEEEEGLDEHEHGTVAYPEMN